ncbi:MAG: hypothetical protein KGS48_06965 [Bacteroidetes bacterium]|nr:hypothetical protein [Bacteroidota bacterium]
MDQQNNIDAHLRQRIYNTEVPPPPSVWPSIEAELRKRKRRFVFWIWFGAGIASLGASFLAIHLYIVSPTRFHAVNMPQESSTLQSANTRLEESNRGALETNMPEIAPIPNAKNPHLRKNPIQQPSKLADRNTLAGPVGSGRLQSIASVTASKTAEQRPGMAQPVAPIAFPGTPNQFKALFELPFNTLSGVFSENKPIQTPKTVPFNARQKKKEPKACYNFDKHPNAWFFDAYGGPSLAHKTLGTTNPEFYNYLNRRKSTEKRDWAYNAGVRGTLVFDQHFLIRAGLHYEQMTEVYTFFDPNAITIDYRDHYYTVNGQTFLVRDTLGFHYGIEYTKIYNRFGMLEIPVEAGVEFRKGRTGFSFNAGLSFNVLFWKRGAVISPAGNTKYFTPGKAGSNEIFQKRTGLSAICSIQWFYHLKPRLRLFAEPYYRQIIQPVNVGSHPINTQYGLGGINFGITKIL